MKRLEMEQTKPTIVILVLKVDMKNSGLIFIYETKLLVEGIGSCFT